VPAYATPAGMEMDDSAFRPGSRSLRPGGVRAYRRGSGLVMIRIVLRFAFAATCFIAAAAAPAFGAEHWVEYRSGPFHVYSDAGDRPARERLNEMEQLRFVLAQTLGKQDLTTMWPIDLVLFSNTKEYAPHALPQPLSDGGSATLAAWTADIPLARDAVFALTRLLLDDNTNRVPEEIETGLCDLFSTIKVNGPKVLLGAPPPAGELPADRMRAWAKVQLLASTPDYSGKFHIFLNNLQQGGDPDAAIRNAFDLTPEKFKAAVDAYVQAAKFEASPFSGRAINLNRDFVEKPAASATVEALFEELKAAGKTFPPDSPRGLLAKGTPESLALAAKANPRWGEPHYRMAALQTNSVAKIQELKTATTLEPRKAVYWQALAEAEIAADQYADAEKAWTAAERTAPTDAERQRIHQTRLDMDDKRAAFETSERIRIATEKAEDLQRIKDQAAAEVHEAERAANEHLAANSTPVKPGSAVPYSSVDGARESRAGEPNSPGENISGKLTRVDCLKGPMRLTIQMDGGGTIRLLIRDPNQVAVEGSSGAQLVCGVQKFARKITVLHNARADAKMDTVGDITAVEFP